MVDASIDARDGMITETGVTEMEQAIGRKRIIPGWNSEVTRDGIWHFAAGVGDDNPLWWDETYAQKSPWGGLVAPPYYLMSHITGPMLKPEHGQLPSVEFLPGAASVFSGLRWEWQRPVGVGEAIAATAELADVKLSKNDRGTSVTQVEKIELQTSTGEIVAVVHNTIKRFERIGRSAASLPERPLATYGAEDRKSLQDHYEAECASVRRGAEPRYIEDVAIGATLGPMLKGPLTIANIIGFLLGCGSPFSGTNRLQHEQQKMHPSSIIVHPISGVLDQFGAVHWDDAVARLSGAPAPYDEGPQRFSWFAHLLTDWAGDHGFLVSLDFRFKGLNLLGDLTWISGQVIASDTASRMVTVELSGINQLNQVNSTAVAVVRLPRRAA